MRHHYALAVALCLSGCGLLDPSVEETWVEGTVYREGLPVEGVVLTLQLGEGGGAPCCRWFGSDTTDADGRYFATISRAGSDSCEGDGWVEVEPASRSAKRLYSTERRVLEGVECGRGHSGVDFHFSGDLWYGGVTIRQGNNDVVPDSVVLEPGEGGRFSAAFSVSMEDRPAYIHADSLSWAWGGTVSYQWEFNPDVLADVTDYGGDEIYYLFGSFVDVLAADSGTTALVAALQDSPFADTVTVVVSSGTSPR